MQRMMHVVVPLRIELPLLRRLQQMCCVVVIFEHQMHMAALRVRGRAAVGCTTFLRALGLNIHRVAAYKAAC